MGRFVHKSLKVIEYLVKAKAERACLLVATAV